MSDKYAGLCIGGPMAGQTIVQSHQHFYCEEFEKLPLREALEKSVEGVTRSITPSQYRWQHIGPFALWLHESTDLNQALNDMAVAYQEKHSELVRKS